MRGLLASELYHVEPETAWTRMKLKGVRAKEIGPLIKICEWREHEAQTRDLPRQLRLRGLGGQVVVDPAPMPKKDRRQVESALKAALKKDAVETIVVGWTNLGLLELQRKRDRVPVGGLL